MKTGKHEDQSIERLVDELAKPSGRLFPELERPVLYLEIEDLNLNWTRGEKYFSHHLGNYFELL